MAQTMFKGNTATLNGSGLQKGDVAPDFSLVAADLSEKTLASYEGKTLILNIFPSLDTGICALSVKAFNDLAAKNKHVQVLHISKDLPFAQKRFCQTEGIHNSESLSAFRSSFSDDYHLTLQDTPLKGLCARSVLVIDTDRKISYAELVAEITTEPNYDAVSNAIS